VKKRETHTKVRLVLHRQTIRELRNLARHELEHINGARIGCDELGSTWGVDNCTTQ
jgi:hypothetical protein